MKFILQNDRLNYLEIENCRSLKRDFVKSFPSCTSLHTLSITSCIWFHGDFTLPPTLKSLTVQNCQLWKNAQLQQALVLPDLTALHVVDCPLKSPLAPYFVGKNLVRLTLSKCDISLPEVLEIFKNVTQLVVASVQGLDLDEKEFITKTILMKHPEIQELTSPMGFTMFYSGHNPSYWTYAVQIGPSFEVYQRQLKVDPIPLTIHVPNMKFFNSIRKKQIWHKNGQSNLELQQMGFAAHSNVPDVYHLCKNSVLICKFSMSRFAATCTYKFEIPNNPIQEVKVTSMTAMTFYRFNLFGSPWEVKKDFQLGIIVPPRMNITLMVPMLTILTDHLLLGKSV